MGTVDRGRDQHAPVEAGTARAEALETVDWRQAGIGVVEGEQLPVHGAPSALCGHGIVTLIVLSHKGPVWIPFQAAALALSHTLKASFRNRLNVSLLHK